MTTPKTALQNIPDGILFPCAEGIKIVFAKMLPVDVWIVREDAKVLLGEWTTITGRPPFTEYIEIQIGSNGDVNAYRKQLIPDEDAVILLDCLKRAQERQDVRTEGVEAKP